MNIPPSVWLQAVIYVAAGINHFWHPRIYYRIMPPYLPAHQLLNTASGIFEILFGFMLLFRSTRELAAWGIVAMLIAFIPAHIYLIQISRCKTPGFCLPWLLAVIRLFPGQLLLIAWAYSQRNV